LCLHDTNDGKHYTGRNVVVFILSTGRLCNSEREVEEEVFVQ